jgi:hypothetical protein
MKSVCLMMLAVAGSLCLVSCIKPPEDEKPVPPTTSTSRMPWNRPQPGEGQAQFGGMLERR